MNKNYEMGAVIMPKKLQMFTRCDLCKFIEVSWFSLVSIDYSNRKSVRELLLHDFGDLIAAFLMIATGCTYQCFNKIGVDITLRNYIVSALIHWPRYASRL